MTRRTRMGAEPLRRMPPPRELVVASAGAGKTYRLSSRIIELLASGAAPEEIFASTFTRKAAGEILERVLLRLAVGGSEEKGMADPELTRLECLHLLEILVRRLHAVNVGTLDSFFQRMARAFQMELGLPPGWTLSDGPAEEGLQAEAVARLLDRVDEGALVELLRLLQGGEARRGVHQLLMDEVAELHDLYRELDPGVADPWGFDFAADPSPSPGRDEFTALAGAIRETPVPLTRKGEPKKNWVKARDKAADELAGGRLEDFVSGGLAGKVLAGDPTYYREEIPDPLLSRIEEGVELVRRALRPRLQARTQALGRLLGRYAQGVEELRRERGRYRFDDVTRALASSVTGGLGTELHYRLDARVRHILLDEFQDTSLAQWWALRPLVAEILSGYEDERGAVIVADPKQSIYGWRGGEPRILEAIQEDFTLPLESLHRSWRSSPVVLDFVNTVFGTLDRSSVIDEELAGARDRWLESFTPHEAQWEALPGHVRVEVGPAGDNPRSSVQPRLLAAAAERVAELHRSCPNASIGVLTRSNRVVSRLIAELRRLGIQASEEGGVPVGDSPAVLSLLALLQLVDHPGDTVARYQVAMTPVNRIAREVLVDEGGPDPDGEGFPWRSTHAAEAVGRRLRERFIVEGYGPVVAGWVRVLVEAADPAAPVSPRDRRLLRQLSELAYQWDEAGGGLRSGEFVRWVREERVQEPSAALVRVMTVHQSKGLEFDVVVLPDLDHSLLPRGGDPVLPFRPRPDAPVSRVFPGVRRELLPLFPELTEASLQSREAGFRDGLSGLYVALTRARFALELMIRPDGKSVSSASTPARIVREALSKEERIEPGQLLFERGSREWWEDPRAPERFRRREAPPASSSGSPGDAPTGDAPPEGVPTPEAPLPLFRAATARRRLLPRRSPSELEGGGRLRLAHLLHQGAAEARLRGSLVHAWFEAVGWIEDGEPSTEELRAIAGRVAPELRDLEGWIGRFREWLRDPRLRPALSRESYPKGARLHRERPFLVRDGGRLVQGVVDRLVVAPHVSGSPRAWILDYKTDRALDGIGERYRPQIEAYRRAVAREEGVPVEAVEAALVVLEARRLVSL
jgi:ATP-dependent helicase/nuclease subunit A